MQKKDATKAKVTSAVSIGPREGGGFGIAVKMRVEDKSLSQAELAALVPGAEAFIIEGRDHMKAVGDRTYKDKAVDFLRSHRLA